MERHGSWGYWGVKWLRKQCENNKKFINSLWSRDTTCRHRSGSTFVQIKACCLGAPSHYPNQRWLICNFIRYLKHQSLKLFWIMVQSDPFWQKRCLRGVADHTCSLTVGNASSYLSCIEHEGCLKHYKLMPTSVSRIPARELYKATQEMKKKKKKKKNYFEN